MTKKDIAMVARLLRQGVISQREIDEEIGGLDKTRDWVITQKEWRDIIQNELLPVAEEKGLSLLKVMQLYSYGGADNNWEEAHWNTEVEQDTSYYQMHMALLVVGEEEFPESVLEKL